MRNVIVPPLRVLAPEQRLRYPWRWRITAPGRRVAAQMQRAHLASARWALWASRAAASAA